MRSIAIRAATLSFLIALAASPSAFAQAITNNAVPPTDAKKAMANEAKAAQRPALPPGLPGAHDDRGGAAPSSELAAAMTPEDALFDAVNRGDVAGARAALARGADVEGRNILGLTPIELAVDLGRNDMTFLLLSMRSGTPQGHSTRSAAMKTAAPPPMPVHQPPPAAARTVASNPMPVRYTNDPGAPAPAAGFLGFGKTSP